MNLKELALREYREYMRKQEQVLNERATRFAQQAKRFFKEIFSVEPQSVTPISPDEVLIECDGIKLVAKPVNYQFRTDIEFFLVRKCKHCGNETYDKYRPIRTLIDLGKQLSEDSEFVCENCRYTMPNESVEDLLLKILQKLGVVGE